MPLHPVHSIDLLQTWLGYRQTVQTARYVMDGYRLHRLPIVLEAGQVGYVTKDSIDRATGSELLEKFVIPFKITIDAQMSARHAASIFVREEVSEAPVMQDSQFLGLLTSNLLLKQLSRVWDPLTGLTWTEDVRAWGSEQLRMGRELSVVIFDVVDMSSYNTKYGHDEGDKLLQKIAADLTVGIDASREVLVRHSGDKFLVATLRTAEESEILASKLQKSVTDRQNLGEKGPVGFIFGSSGGRRSGDRIASHPEATLDDLIRLASENCAITKISNYSESNPTNSNPTIQLDTQKNVVPSQIPVVLEIVPQDSSQHRYRVTIGVDDQQWVGIDGKPSIESSEAIASATCRALEQAYNHLQVTVTQSQGFREPNGRFTAMFGGNAKFEGKSIRLSGISSGEATLAHALSKATIEAVHSAISKREESPLQ